MNLKKELFFLFIFICPLLTSYSDDNVQSKIIRNKEYDLYFQVKLKEKSSTKDRMYYWYKSGEIHNSFGEVGGPILHNTFSKYFKGNQLAEKGHFKNGLKTGVWKKWFREGSLSEESRWSNGQPNGWYREYDQSKNIILEGKYRNGKKVSYWVNHISKDTTWYKKGRAYKEYPKIVKKREDSIAGKESFWKNLFKKKDSVNNEETFFQRLFSKKKDTIQLDK